MNGLGIVAVLLPSASSFMPSQAVQGQIGSQSQGIKGLRVVFIHPLGDILHGDAAHPADRSREIPVDDISGNTDGLKNLCALIGLDGGNTHFGGDLHNAVQHAVGVIIHRRIVIFVQQMLVNQLLDGIQGQVGIHRTGAVSQKRRKMMNLSGFSGLQNQRHGCLFFRPHQVLVYGGNRQQGGNRHMVFIHAPVGKHQDIGAILVDFVHLHEQTVDGPLQVGALVIGDGNHCRLEAVHLHLFDFQHIRIGENGIVDLHHLTVFRFLFQQISLLAHIDRGAGNNLLTDGIDGRIGHLRKQLFEIIEQRTVFPGKHCQGDIISHGRGGFPAV